MDVPDHKATFEIEEQCAHCLHPKHEGICGIMTPTLVDDSVFGKKSVEALIACQCRVEPSLPASFKEGWIRTFTGKKIHFLDPQPEEICLEDIAHHLALKNRFSGATKHAYSVALHSMIGAVELLSIDPVLSKPFLFHDAEEAYLPDVPAPMKHLMPWWEATARNLNEAICEKFEISPLLAANPGIKKMDRLLADEEGDLLVNGWKREFTAGPTRSLRSLIILATDNDWRTVAARFERFARSLDRKGFGL